MNQQDRKGFSEGLRPSQDFQVNDKVTYNGEEGIIFKIEEESRFPVRVKLPNDVIEAFMADGRTWWAGQVVLFRLEEDYKPEQTTTNKAPFSRLQAFKTALAALLQEHGATIACDVDGDTHGLSYEMSVQFDGEGYKDHKLCNGYELDHYDLLKSLEKGR